MNARALNDYFVPFSLVFSIFCCSGGEEIGGIFHGALGEEKKRDSSCYSSRAKVLRSKNGKLLFLFTL